MPPLPIDLKGLLVTSLLSIVITLITGKFVRKIVVILAGLITRKTATKIDDELLETAKKDLGVEGDEQDGK